MLPFEPSMNLAQCLIGAGLSRQDGMPVAYHAVGG
jgi:hypothetical protein